MRQWIGSTLVQVMACRLFGAKPLPEPMRAYIVNCTLGNKFHLNRNSYIFIQENAIENAVGQIGGHFVQGQMSWCLQISHSITSSKVNPKHLAIYCQVYLLLYHNVTVHCTWHSRMEYSTMVLLTSRPALVRGTKACVQQWWAAFSSQRHSSATVASGRCLGCREY